jgi:predicted acylesterase/phospholipase RssA
MLQKFKRFAGTSIGAIFAALLAADFTAFEILGLEKKMYKEISSCKYDLIHAFNILKNNGINSLDSLKKQVQKVINKKLKPDITLNELFKKTGKELVINS